jgi:Tfp pilus assembly PilM family ATPase
MRMIGRSRTPIGIDVGSRSIKAAQLRKSDGRHHIAALSMSPRAKLTDEIHRQEILDLKSVLRRQGFCGNQIVLAAQEEKLLRGTVELPAKMSGAPVAQVARIELSRMHDAAPSSFEMICWELPTQGKSKSTTQAIAVGCPHGAANTLLDVFEGCGFNVCALDVRSAAAARACMSLTAPQPAVTCMLDLGWNSTKLLLVSGDKVIYDTLLTANCMSKLILTLKEESGITEESAYQIVSTVGFVNDSRASECDQEFADVIRKKLRRHFDTVLEELNAPFAYANRQYPGGQIERLLLIGGGARISGLAQYVEAALDIEVMSVGPSDVVDSSPQIMSKASNPAMTVAVGLAQFAGG